MVNENLQQLPLGEQSFPALRLRNKIYVDKTDMVYQLASFQGGLYFLARPRRFGKSLLVSTFESLFKFGLRDFHGLKIEKLWKDEGKYSVVKLDFSGIGSWATCEDFKKALDNYFVDLLRNNHLNSPFATNTEGLRAFNNWLRVQPNNSVVLLIDEYDAPLTRCLDNQDLFDKVRTILADFYHNMKACSGCLRFLFMTGITKFSKASIFSGLNNLKDISLNPKYGCLLGYTHEELEQYFSGYLDKASKALLWSRKWLLEELTNYYDGFCFEEAATQRVFAPWSLLNFFSEPERGLKNYWTDSAGNPSVLNQYLKTNRLRDPNEFFTEKSVSFNDLSATVSDSSDIDDLVLLTQTGYLTIKAIEADSFVLGYPNKEVADSLAKIYRDRLLSSKSLSQVGAGSLLTDLREGNVDSFVEQINKAFLSISYQDYAIDDESTCRKDLALMLFLGAGVNTFVERQNALGRSDIEVETEKTHWVIEIKFMPKEKTSEGTAKRLLKEALEQIKERQYGKSERRKRKLIRLGLVFSEKDRHFVKYGCVQ